MPPWMKLWPEKLLTPEFFLLSANARSVLVFALVLAARAEESGVPMTVADLQVFTHLPLQKVRLAVNELLVRGMIALDGETVRSPLYHDMQAKVDRTRAERQAAWRAKQDAKRNALDATNNASGNGESNAENRYEEKARGTEDTYSPSLTGSTTPPETSSTASGKPPQPKQTRLVDPAVVRAGEILGLLWPRVSVAVTKAMTKTEWGKRNKRAALDLARVGVADGALIAAHEALCERRGEVVYTVAWLQDELARGVVKDPTDDLPLIFPGGTVPHG